ncbi:hypothetical protein ACNQKP_13895 [Bdellovibrio bacteriovorus]|uniref:hypothetical protein n=1 Tax=Bdellovibrio bacteriovorus TaxID=959 RepID=UPI003AA84CEF
MKSLIVTSLTLMALHAGAQTPPADPVPGSETPEQMPSENITLTAPQGEAKVDLKSAHHTNKDVVIGELKKCHDQTVAEAKAANQPIPVGKVVVDFSFDSEGTVTNFQFKENRIRPASEALNSCIENSIRQAKFEKLQSQRAGKVVSLFYPYIFEVQKTKKK